jgi:threonine dehydrogenase-like Zn-dependent dehydrogenase
VGAHNVRVVRLTGAAPIIAVDPLPGARERALTFGADVALDPAAPDFAEQVSKVTGGRGIDFAFDCAGCPPSASKPPPCWARAAPSSWSASPRPLTISEGLTFDCMCKQVRGHYGGTPKSVDELVRLASHGRLDLAPSITEHLPLADAAEAVRLLENKIGDPIRLILVP